VKYSQIQKKIEAEKRQEEQAGLKQHYFAFDL
jgi:hypothetical protein